MKKIICIIFLIICGTSISQSSDFNLQKYWYLRWRLKNYFMVVGPNYGEGYPAGVRGWLGDNLNYGDAPNYLATYMGVLATEIKLLKQKGMDCSETKRELYYALYALNRWDDCETHYPWGGFDGAFYSDKAFPSQLIGDYVPNPTNLNGACLRMDVPNNFVHKNYGKLHKDIAENFTNNNPGDPPNLLFGEIGGLYNEGLNPQFDFCVEDCGFQTLQQYLTSEEADVCCNQNAYMPCPNNSTPDYCTALERVRSASMLSLDHISSLLMGLSLVTRSLEEDETWVANVFQDGEISFVKEARNIARRLRDYMRSNNYTLVTPANLEIEKRWGGKANFMHEGYEKAFARILNEPNNLSVLNENFQWHVTLSLAPSTNSSTAWIVLKLFSVNNSNGGPFFSNDTEYNQEFIHSLSSEQEWQNYYPLIHSYLHNFEFFGSQNDIHSVLESMPCDGHYYLGNELKSEGWATSHKFHDSPQLNLEGSSAGTGAGTFNGLEYMLMMNLMLLKFPNYEYDIKYNNFSGKIEPAYPYTTGLETIGANPIIGLEDYKIKPALIYSNEPLTINTNISNGIKTITKFNFPSGFTSTEANLTANVTFRSAKGIDVQNLGQGEGTILEIENDPYECNSAGTDYEYRPLDNSNQIGKGQNIQEQRDSTRNGEETSITTIEDIMVENKDMEIRPNPSSGMFYLAKNQSKVSEITVTNLLGEVIFHTTKIYDETVIDLSSQKNACYIVTCFDGTKEKRFKIFKI